MGDEDENLQGVILALEICEKCSKYVAFFDSLCVHCYVPDIPDTALIYEDK